jgi:dolichol-phosphate mannosyltransferase
VVLPTYNERENIAVLVERVLRACSHGMIDVLVVDDDSPDGTWEVVRKMAEADPRVRLVRRVDERGLTSAIAAGTRSTQGRVVVWMDCDLSMPPETIPALVAAVAEGACQVAVGSRYVRGGKDVGHPPMARALSRCINWFAGLLLGFSVHDYTSGFVAARREVLDLIALRGDYGEYCIDFLVRARRHGFSVCEVPYTCEARRGGVSKTGTGLLTYLRRGWKYVTTVTRLAWSRS